MKIGLASYEFRDRDIAFNLSQIERAMIAAQGKVELLCFGETFLQGFNALCWNYEEDRKIAASMNAPMLQKLCAMTVQYGTGLLLGYIEHWNNALYSSCAVMDGGKLLHNYKRISKGWKEFDRTDAHYREGDTTGEFQFRGQTFMLALCGDLWDFPDRFRTDCPLIWPVYVNFTLDQWTQYETEYAEQARLASRRALLVNPISQDPASHGGAFYFADGKIVEKLAFDTEGILIVDI